MRNVSYITTLIEHYAKAVQRSPRTVGRWAAGDGGFYDRLKRGCDITTRRSDRVTQWFSDRWPADLDWPADIPRPAPTPGSPASEQVA